MTAQPPFAFGQTIYVARADAHYGDLVPCPMCFGKLTCTLTLGNGESTPVECEFCGKGYDGPKGVVEKYGARSSVIESTVTGMSRDKFFDEGWCVNGTAGVSERLSAGNVFTTREEAESRRVVLHAQAEQQAQQNFESQFKKAKNHTTWSVGYHRKCLADLERQSEWHRSKLAARVRVVVERVEEK